MTEDKKIFATPKVRKFARELGANVFEIQGTERKGRITEHDVKNYIANQLSSKDIKLSKKVEVFRWLFIFFCIIISPASICLLT